MKIYTKRGDKGKTSLASGRRVVKSDPLIEAYGSVDELNSFIGDLLNKIDDQKVRDTLTWIQNSLFNIGSLLARDGADFTEYPTLTDDHVLKLESTIDQMNEILPPMTAFILPGGSETISKAHICRTICRRTERRVQEVAEELESSIILKFLNRLSDYFFVLARWLHQQDDIAEVNWGKN